MSWTKFIEPKVQLMIIENIHVSVVVMALDMCNNLITGTRNLPALSFLELKHITAYDSIAPK